MVAEGSERLDIFSPEGKWLGTDTRASVHRLGLWHQTFHAWITTVKPQGTYVWFQQRAQQKQQYPGLWDVTVAGHLLAGEEPYDGIREVHEELGFAVPLTACRYMSVEQDQIHMPDFTDREMCHVFHIAWDLSAFRPRLNPDEVAAVGSVPLQEAIAWAMGAAPAMMIRVAPSGEAASVTFDDVVPHTTSYYVNTLKALAAM